jgi:hypothetical protein
LKNTKSKPKAFGTTVVHQGEQMNPKYLYTIRWTQPYATDYLRPYLKQLQLEMEQTIESRLEQGDFAQAKIELERIMAL